MAQAGEPLSVAAQDRSKRPSGEAGRRPAYELIEVEVGVYGPARSVTYRRHPV